MKTTICRKAAAILMAILTCISAFAGIGLSVSAAGTQTEAYLIDFPRAGETQLHNWGHGRLRYMNGWFAEESTHTTLYTTGSYTGNICYCIEPGTPLATGDLFTLQKDESFWDSYPSDYNKTISADTVKTHIGRILQYGYTGTISPDWKSQNEGANELAHAYATQLLIWETIVGERDEDFNHVSTGGYNAILDCVSDAHPLRERILAHYDSIVSSVKNHGKLPSFCTKSAGKAETVELEWDGTQYTVTLTDTNNVLGNYAFSSNAADIQFHSNGNHRTICAK